MLPNLNAVSNCPLNHSPAIAPPAKQSPAPVGSTTLFVDIGFIFITSLLLSAELLDFPV